MGQRCVRDSYDIRFPTLARSSSGSKGLYSQAHCRATPNGSYIQCLYNIGHALTRGNARPFDHFFLLFAPQDSRTISDDFKVICLSVFCPSSCSSINSITASAIAS